MTKKTPTTTEPAAHQLGMKETPAERNQRLDDNRENGRFGTSRQAEQDKTLVLPEAPYWDNGGSQEGVTVIESPVSDRERNYSLTFNNGGYITVNPFMFGIESPETSGQYSGDRDSLFIGAGFDVSKGDALQVQFCYAADSEDLASEVEDLNAEELSALEKTIVDDLKAEFGDSVVIEFSSGGDRWDDVQVMYNTSYPGAERGLDGRLNAFTSNIMAVLEVDDQYLKVRNGFGETIIYNALQKHSVSV
jgi:hypothetical protein